MNKIWITIGILCFTIPFILQIYDKKSRESIIETYQKDVEVVDNEELKACLADAQEYNQILHEVQQNALYKEERLRYEDQLNLSKTGMMGHIEIPEISVKLPIYHGTSEDILSAGIGHLEGTSLPVGGENSHAVLTGHCGVPSAELFTRLDELEKGDLFFVQVCKEILKYKVVNIQVVKPEKVDVLSIENGKDLISLVTCTPYGINTHRLIVTGQRMEEEMVMEDEGGVDEKIYYNYFVFISVFLFLGCRSFLRGRKNHGGGARS